MAVTAKFIADFTSFDQAVTKASAELKTFEQDANKVGASLNRMGDQFSGKKIIQDATLMAKAVDEVGGVTKLTDKELQRLAATTNEAAEKMRAMGISVPESFTKISTAATQAAKGVDTLGKETTNLGAAAEKTGKPVSALSGWFTNLGTQLVSTAAGFVSAQAVIGVANKAFDLISSTIRGSITAYAEAEAAQTKLITALRSQGQATPDVINQYNKLASQFQDTTVFSDDLVNSMQGLLVQVGGVMPRQMEAALKASTDLAAGLGIDLETATTLVAKAAAGHTETLGKYGIQVSEAEVKTKGLTAVLDAVNKQFGGQATAQLETYAGQLKQAENAWNNLQEAVGKFIVQSPLVVAGIRGINNALKDGEKELSESSFSLVDFLGLWVGPQNAQALKVASAWAETQNNIATAWQRMANVPSPFKKMGDDLANMKFPDPGGLDFFKGMVVAEEEIAKATKKANEELTKYNDVVKDVATTGRDYADVIDEIDGRVVAGIRYYLDRGVAVEKLATMYKLTTAQVEAIKSVMEAEQSVLDKSKTEWDAITASIEKSRNTTVQAKTVFDGMIMTWDQMKNTGKGLTFDGLIPMAKGFDDLARKAYAAKLAEDELKKSHEALARSMSIPMMLPDVHSSIEGLKHDTQSLFDSITGGFSDVLGQLNDIFVKAFEGGGDIGGAIKALGTRLLEKMLALIPVVGQFLSKFAGAIVAGFTKLFKSAESQINPLRDKFVDAAGGLDKLRDKATAAGTTIDALLNAKNAKEYEKAVKDLEKAFKDLDQSVADTKVEMEGIDKLKGMFDKIGGALSDSMRDALRQLASIPGLSKDAAAALMGLANDTQPNFKELEKTAEEYGITLAQLGSKFQQAHVSDEAAKIISDFENLKNAGADVGNVINGMAGAVQHVVDESEKFGVDVPENMRPMIEAMINAGLLTDAAGKKITDISQIKFGKPVETEADKIAKAIKDLGELFEKLPTIMADAVKGINNSLAGINTRQDIDIYTHHHDVYDNPVAGAATGGYVTATGIQNFAGGGRVLPFRARGTDTVPAMLTPGEGILSRADMLALGGVAGFKSLRSLLRTGGSSGGDSSTIEKTLADIRSELRRSRLTGPAALARAVRDEVQKAGGRR